MPGATQRNQIARGALKYLTDRPVMGGAVVVTCAAVAVVWIVVMPHNPDITAHDLAHMLDEHNRRFEIERRLAVLESRVSRLESIVPTIPLGADHPYGNQQRTHP